MTDQLHKQAITPDWVEMHFSLADGALFASKSQLQQHRTVEQEREKTNRERGGKALPKVTAQGKETLRFGDTTFKRRIGRTKFYLDTFDIYHRGKKFAWMGANSVDKALTPLDDIQVKLYNNKLYEEGWLDDLIAIATKTEAKFHNFTRVDIAIDGHNFLCQFDDWYSKKIVKTGRAAVNAHFDNNRKCTGFYIGKGNSKKNVKIYNKSGELNRSNKTYISRYWKLHDINTDIPVERLEMTLRNEEAQKFEEINWLQLDQPAHLASIMRSCMDKFCDFRRPNGQKNISRMDKIEIVNWDAFNAAYLDKDSTRPTTEIYRAKITLKLLYEIFLRTQQQSWFDHAFEIAINSDLVEYFNNRQKDWAEEVEYKLGKNRDGVISDTWTSHFKSYDVAEQITIFEHDKVKA